MIMAFQPRFREPARFGFSDWNSWGTRTLAAFVGHGGFSVSDRRIPHEVKWGLQLTRCTDA